eukprot:CAMPEP_0194355798 /NCGR_PEP_ID=MMETSP0174-20130528/3662_1 /TAXON_ID=216777 /ORGANISM="Proboscia alata, Strain PI-D3" /LENGTH=392 /DNA_ID=CAMNT_0039125221 /DNA_START=28 /DNA_END=1206 /DNA_ORIENTATION=-
MKASMGTAMTAYMVFFLPSSTSLSTFDNLLSNLSGNSNQVKVGRVKAGPIDISAMGAGTWSWGNFLLLNFGASYYDEIFGACSVLGVCVVFLFSPADLCCSFELNGRAEILLGQFEKRYLSQISEDESSIPFPNFVFGKQESVSPQQVATKFAPYPWRISRSSMVNAARESLRRLDQEKLALAQLHWSTANYQPFQEKALWEGIADVYDEGLCSAIGVSNYGPQQLLKISQRMEERNVPIATAQIQYSLMTYKDPLTSGMDEVCKDMGTRVIAYSPLCLGLLTGKYSLETNTLPPPGNPRRQLFTELLPGAKELLNLLEAVSIETGKTQSQIAINWTICKGGVPIPGAKNLKQAQENLGAIGWKLKDDVVEELDRTAKSISKPMIQNIFQTK